MTQFGFTAKTQQAERRGDDAGLPYNGNRKTKSKGTKAVFRAKNGAGCRFDVVPRFGDFGSPAEDFLAECPGCAAKSLHVLNVGYSFFEWVCDICGARTDTPVVPDLRV